MFSHLLVSTLIVAAQGTPAIPSCAWLAGKLHVSWDAPEDALADYYEVQLADTADGNITSVFSTAKTMIDLEHLLSETTYWATVRAHAAGMPSLGPGTWGQPSAAVKCQTGKTLAARVGATTTGSSFLLEVMRQSEFTYDVDYLMNHNSGDIEGDAAFVTGFSGDPDQKGFLNTTFRWSTFTRYCVEVLSVTVPDTVTTDGNANFADYFSCNDNHNATDPKCSCDNTIDRSLSKADDQLKYCHTSAGAICKSSDVRDCKCTCTADSTVASAEYIGMMPVYYRQAELLGYWYSHPTATECNEDEIVGQKRADGSQCTWKRHGEARVLRGADVLSAGWNATTSGSHFSHTLDPAQARQNAQAFRTVFDSRPYQPWSCGDAKRTNTHIVV